MLRELFKIPPAWPHDGLDGKDFLVFKAFVREKKPEASVANSVGPGPPLPPRFLQIMQFSGNFKRETPILSQPWVS